MGDTPGWTTDAQGNYVDWTKPPYLEYGRLSLVLEGEDYHRLPFAVRKQRIIEYNKLMARYRNNALLNRGKS